jgi:glycine/D-amino acid oxidase-like deaminating enzyme
MSASGSLLIGSSREMGTWDATPEPAVVDDILDHALKFLPGLGAINRATVETRVGLRPYCLRGQPLIGPVPGSPGLYVAAGHEGSGLTLGPATGDIIKEWLLYGLPRQALALDFLPPDG